jgi:hypothetical protein
MSKINEKGDLQKHKGRLVARGFVQQHGVDYGETHAPVASLEIVRAILVVATHNSWIVYQIDVRSSFLNGILSEEVYVNRPLGYEIYGQEYKVYQHKRA